MDKELAYKILDEVLTILQNNAAQLNKLDLDWHLQQQGTTLADKILLEAIDKLYKDGYINIERHPVKTIQGQPIADYYAVTLSGHIFEGYIKAAASEASELDTIAAIEQSQRALSEASHYVNKWIMRGTIGAGVIGLLVLAWYIFSFGYDHHWWFAYCTCK